MLSKIEGLKFNVQNILKNEMRKYKKTKKREKNRNIEYLLSILKNYGDKLMKS